MISQAILGSALEIPKVSDAFQQRVFNDHVTGASGMAELFRDRELFKPYDPDKTFRRSRKPWRSRRP
jgi:hypothetical protein